MADFVYGDGQWGVIVNDSTTWFDDMTQAMMYAGALEMTPQKAAQVLDDFCAGLTP